MVFRFFILLIGFGMAVGGGVTIILYLNVMTVGHNLMEYVHFIINRIAFYLFVAGILLVWASISFPFHKHNSHH